MAKEMMGGGGLGMKEGAGSFDTLAVYQNVWPHIPEDRNRYLRERIIFPLG